MMETATQTEDRWEEKNSAKYKEPSREDVKIPQAKSVSFDKVGNTLYHITSIFKIFDEGKNVCVLCSQQSLLLLLDKISIFNEL